MFVFGVALVLILISNFWVRKKFYYLASLLSVRRLFQNTEWWENSLKYCIHSLSNSTTWGHKWNTVLNCNQFMVKTEYYERFYCAISLPQEVPCLIWYFTIFYETEVVKQENHYSVAFSYSSRLSISCKLYITLLNSTIKLFNLYHILDCAIPCIHYSNLI